MSVELVQVRLQLERFSLEVDAVLAGRVTAIFGASGAGKTSLLEVIAGLRRPATGMIRVNGEVLTNAAPHLFARPERRGVGYVPQEAEFPESHTVYEVIAAVIAGEHLDEAERAARISQTLGRAGFVDATVRTEALSGGWKRRLAIAREIAQAPDVLFLDEPTNHLDFEGLRWLEKLLSTAAFASVIVSHDRYFLDTVVNDVAEIDRAFPGGLFRVEGRYSQFLEKKEEFLLGQSNRQEALANRVRREVEWWRHPPLRNLAQNYRRLRMIQQCHRHC